MTVQCSSTHDFGVSTSDFFCPSLQSRSDLETVHNFHGLKLPSCTAEKRKRHKPVFGQPQGKEHLGTGYYLLEVGVGGGRATKLRKSLAKN